jgi:hypothetical protein
LLRVTGYSREVTVVDPRPVTGAKAWVLIPTAQLTVNAGPGITIYIPINSGYLSGLIPFKG